MIAEIVDVRVIHPLTVEGNRKVRDRTFASGYQQIFGTIGMQQHQIRTRLKRDRLGEVGKESLMLVITGALRSDVGDVVIPSHRLVLSNRLGLHIDGLRK